MPFKLLNYSFLADKMRPDTPFAFAYPLDIELA